MKKITLLFTVLIALGFTSLQAQSCAGMKKVCMAKSASTAQSCHGTSVAAKLASLDGNIEQRICKETGKVSYVTKETSLDGKVTFTSVNYDSDLGKFVNIAPSEKKACCDKDMSSGCCSKGATAASAVKTSLKGDKAGCSAAQKACCAKKNSGKVAEVGEAKVTLVKAQRGS